MSWVLGIDLGTSFTAAGLVSGRRLEAMALGAHSSAIPSAVFKGEESMMIGDAAIARGDANPDRLVVEFKRQLGESSPILAGEEFVTAEELQALLGSWVFARACELEGSEPSHVVFTFPAFWGAFRRDTFLGIARQIVRDTDRVELLTEPEAAAAYYASRDRLPSGTIVGVYDLGGGTFDASILRKTDTAFEVLGRPAGDDQLGGVDLDNILLRHVTERAGVNWEELDREDPRASREMMHLRRNVTVAKEMLSQEMSTEIGVAIGSIVTTVRLTRRELEQLAEPMISRTLVVFDTALAYASIRASDLHSILLVGAASRMPRIAEALTERFHVPLALDSHPKFAVCLGAAISSQRDGQPEVAAPLGPWAPPDVTDDAPQAAEASHDKQSRRVGRPWWYVAAAAVILVAAIAAVVLLRGGGPGGTVVMVPATQGFTDTGIVVAQGDVVTVDASGTINHAPGVENTAGPDGVNVPAFTIYNIPDNGSVLDAPHAALVAKVGDGRPFVIGSHHTFSAVGPGRLYLGVNDVGVANNSGAFSARVRVQRA